jgi:hypothetical protein
MKEHDMEEHLGISPDGMAAARPAGPATAAPEAPAHRAPLLVAGALFLFVLLMIAAALGHLRPAAPGSASSAATDFSTTRALEDVFAVSRATHPTGSAENTRVRDYLAGRLRALGLAPEAQSGQVFNAREGVLGAVTNLVARLPGRERGAPALLLAAHYDSAPTSPGAADDGASVAAILETVRLLKAGPALRNDVVVLLTDGEEAGLLGSQLFVERLASATATAGQGERIGAVLNFEYRGDRGPVWLFETSPGNGRLIDAWRQAVPHPVGNSLLSEVYRVLPNDTDMTSFRRGGIAGLNFAAGQGYLAYHTQRDSADALDPASLQHMGDTMLRLARRLGDEDLAAVRASDAVYFDAPVIGAVSYEAALALPLQLVALGLLAATWVRRRKDVRAARVSLALPVLVGAVVLVAIACQLAWMGIWLAHPGYQLLLHGATYNGDLYLGAFAAMGVALFVGMLRLLRRWFTAAELRLGALVLVTLAGLLLAIAMPGASYLLTWPSLPFLLLGAFSRDEAPTPRRAAWLALAAVPAVLLFAPVVQLLFDALTPQNLFAMAGVLGLACLVALPVVDLLSRRYVLPLVPSLIAAGLLAMGTATSGFDAARPRPDNLFFVQDADAHTARWVSDDEALDAWTARFIGHDAKRTPVALLGPVPVPLWVHDAPALDVPGPQVTVVEDHVVDGLRRLTLDVTSPRGAARLVVRAEDVEVRESRVAGQAYRARNPHRWGVEADGLGTTPMRLQLAVPPGKAFAVRVRDIDFGLPANAVGARPADAMAQPFRGSDTTQVLRVVKFPA